MKQNVKRDYAYFVRKYALAAFVVASFAAYAVHDQGTGPNAGSVVRQNQASTSQQQQTPLVTVYPTVAAQPVASGSAGTRNSTPLIGPPAPTKAATTSAPPTQAAPTSVPTTEPTATAVATAIAAKSGFKDGQFTGAVADAYYGPVQVKVVIQNGQITNVQFVDYPHDRRRSAQINAQAMPWLQDEAIQAQSAHVDIISGATLTSQAFIESLQNALDAARS